MSDRIAKAIEALEAAIPLIGGESWAQETMKQCEDALNALRQPSPTMMPDAQTIEAMTTTYELSNSQCPMADALSCDAFRNWMGGVGELALPDLHGKWPSKDEAFAAGCEHQRAFDGPWILPELPPPFNFLELDPPGFHVKDYLATLNNASGKRGYMGQGPTPRAAVLAALANIKTEG